MYGAEWRDPEGASFAMLLQGVLTKIAGIARDRRHRRNLALPITAITRDYGDLGDWTVRTPWSGMAEGTSSGSLSAGINRHERGNGRDLREKRSEPISP